MNDVPKRKFSIADLLDIDKMKQHDKEMNTFYKRDSRKISEKKLRALKEKSNDEEINNLDVEGEKLNDWGTEVNDAKFDENEE